MDELQLTKKAEAYVAASTSFAAKEVLTLQIDRTSRKALSLSITALIDMLDDLSPEPDLEPWLGWPESGGMEAGGDSDDREDENEHGGDINDEPQGGNNGRTLEDDEPNLGWAETHGKGIVGNQNSDDREGDDEREDDPGERGIADADALQWMSMATPLRRSPGANIRNPALAPEHYPDKFCMRADGNCCEPEIMDGGYVLVDKNRPYKRGDFVCIYRNPATVAKGDHVIKVKRLVENYPHALVVEMLNPPQMIFIDKEREVKAVYFCEPAPDGFIPGPKLSEGELLAEKAQRLADGTIMRRFEPKGDDPDRLDAKAEYWAAAKGMVGGNEDGR